MNDYLKEIAGADITAKDFRTWAGTVFVANVLARREGPVGPSHVVAAVREASLRLGNTPAICRKSYVHPRVLDPETWSSRTRRRATRRHPRAARRRGGAAAPARAAQGAEQKCTPSVHPAVLHSGGFCASST